MKEKKLPLILFLILLVIIISFFAFKTSTNIKYKNDDLIFNKQNTHTKIIKEKTPIIFDKKIKVYLNKIKDYTYLKEINSLLQIKPYFLNDIPSMTPLKRKKYFMTSKYGVRKHPISKKIKTHTGLDLAAQKDEKIYATANGIVSYTKNHKKGYGKHILINHSYGFQTKYGHLNTILVYPGQTIKQGDLIGHVGNTGASTGNHLHYEIIKNSNKINPFPSFNLKYKILKSKLDKK